jgi:hypothetical protein
MKDFNRAVALQAVPNQIIQFDRLIKSTQAARKGAQDLLQLAADLGKGDSFHSIDSLPGAVEQAQTDNEQFLQSFSAGQKAGLKEVTKSLGKADSDVTKQSKALTRSLGRSRIDGKRMASALGRLDKALSVFETKQLAVGVEMGLQGEKSSP